ncbi:MAG: beta-propeller domain-containing protein, partial [Thermoplasmata archaeon]
SYVAVFIGGREQVALSTFRSMAELDSFLESRSLAVGGGFLDMEDVIPATATLGGERDYSGTNVQVEGVDESDMVKTDGEFLYIGNQDGVTVLRAYPPEEMAIVSQITRWDLIEDSAEDSAEHLWIAGLFILEDRLVVISSSYGDIVIPTTGIVTLEPRSWSPPGSRTYVSVFDTFDIESPSLLHSYKITGGFQASRMAFSHIYVITQAYILERDDDYSYPEICTDSRCDGFDLQRIFYDPAAEDASSFTNILAIDPLGDDFDYISVIAGYASTVYMSHENLYITFSKSGGDVLIRSPFNQDPAFDGPFTSIYRIGVDGTRLRVAAGGDVPGSLLNQFSMDERFRYLRVVTTSGWSESNNVYVLDEGLELVGALEGLAPGESVYSARFVGDALYMVTFKKVDPFFVIDLSDPSKPKVLGYLKIPGFSEYLHPIDEHHVLGVGKETLEAEKGDFAWFQGLKLSLFDVTEVGEPKEIAKYLIGDRGTSSPVLWDHKAFLYIESLGLIVLPVDLVESNPDEYPDDLPPFAYGEHVWQGVYPVSVTPEGGFELLGTISHLEGSGDSPSQYSPYAIQRALYIGDYLYTISSSMVKANALEDQSLIGYLVYAS